MAPLPTGIVTFLFSDVEGSTQLLERHGAAMGEALARHHTVFEEQVGAHSGVIFETVGDAVYAAFARATDAVAAALAVQRLLATEDWGRISRLAVRIGLHTGQIERRGAHYFGPALFRAARLMAIGHGEQILLSGVTAALVADALPDGASVRDLGSHRLKDLGAPEQAHQLLHAELRAEFPALKSLDAHPHNLPIHLSSFVGRDGELSAVVNLLRAHRLVTLLGPGGIGKTRLALQVAAEQLESFADGAWLVDLAPLRDPELVLGAVATSLGLREQPGIAIAEMLAGHLNTRHLLLVLDNLEQLLPATAAPVGELLALAPQLHVLATSRAPLRLSGEQEYSVPPLPPGDLDWLEAEPAAAVALFLERARAIKPELEVTAESGPLMATICARLDGLPLAIELAAARLRLLSLAQLNQRLGQRLPLLVGGARDLPKRQQTLRAAMAWSIELLSQSERRLFSRLGVFVGGFTFEAAETVAGFGADDVLDGLTVLLEQSLVRRADAPVGEARYTMLETIREYAVELLEALEGDAIVQRHIRHFAELAERLLVTLENADQVETVALLRTEDSNLRVALERACDIDPVSYFRLSHAILTPWLYFDGRLSDCEWMLLLGEGLVGRAHRDDRARWSLDLGQVQFAQGRAQQAAASFDRAMGVADPNRLGRDYAILLRMSAAAARERGELELAKSLVAAARRHALALGHDLELAHVRLTQALIDLREARYDAAVVECREAIDVFHRHGDSSNTGSACLTYGTVLEYKGEFELAAEHYDRARRLFEMVDDQTGVSEAEMALGYLAFLRGDVAAARRALLIAARRMLSDGRRLELTRALTTLAVVLGHAGEDELAAKLIGWCMQELDQLGVRWSPEVNLAPHTGNVPHANVLIRLWGDAKWEAARHLGRVAKADDLLAELRDRDGRLSSRLSPAN